jgi:hypothetical protein
VNYYHRWLGASSPCSLYLTRRPLPAPPPAQPQAFARFFHMHTRCTSEPRALSKESFLSHVILAYVMSPTLCRLRYARRLRYVAYVTSPTLCSAPLLCARPFYFSSAARIAGQRIRGKPPLYTLYTAIFFFNKNRPSTSPALSKALTNRSFRSAGQDQPILSIIHTKHLPFHRENRHLAKGKAFPSRLFFFHRFLFSFALDSSGLDSCFIRDSSFIYIITIMLEMKVWK